jgi:hypothetical protein
MPKMKKYESFSQWKLDQSSKHKDLITLLQKLIKKIAPHLITSVKRGQGCFLDWEKRIMYIHTEVDYIQLWFYTGSSLENHSNLLEGNGKFVRYIKVRNSEDIDEPAFTAIINQVI